jgi:hypothetical protein
MSTDCDETADSEKAGLAPAFLFALFALLDAAADFAQAES